MPDDNGVLTQGEKQKIGQWLTNKGQSQPCPVCMKNDWTLAPHLFQGAILAVNKTTVFQGYPTCFIICENCMFIREFTAGAILNLTEENSKRFFK